MDYHRVKGAKVAVRRQRILGQKDRALEARKAALLAKEAAAEKMIKQRQEVSMLEWLYSSAHLLSSLSAYCTVVSCHILCAQLHCIVYDKLREPTNWVK